MSAPPALHAACLELAPLLGVWRGSGRGDYPTIEDFAYDEELVFTHAGRPFVAMSQETTDAGTGEPRHAESGYLRPRSGGVVELVVCQPSGVVEVDVGSVLPTSDGIELEVTSSEIAPAPTAKSVTEVRRRLVVVGDTLVSELWMAAAGEPLTHHLTAELHRS
ncbi:MAG: FABP family protein [Acidimicrobiales bacterium]